MHPKLKKFFEAKGEKVGEPAGDILGQRPIKKKRPRNATEVLPGMEDPASAKTMPAERPVAAPPSVPDQEKNTIVPNDPVDPKIATDAPADVPAQEPIEATPEQPVEAPVDVEDVAKALEVAFQINNAILSDIKAIREYFSFTGAQVTSRMNYLEQEMVKFDDRISNIEKIVKGMVSQQATPVTPPTV